MQGKRIIGVLMDWYRPDVISGALAFCSGRDDLALDVRWAMRADWVNREVLENWHGVISHIYDAKAVKEMLEEIDLPRVELNVATEHKHRILTDYAACAEMMVEELAEAGCNVVFMGKVNPANIMHHHLFEGAMKAVEKYPDMRFEYFSKEESSSMGQHFLDLACRIKELCDDGKVGFISPHTGVVHTVEEYLLGFGIRIPEQVALISLAKDAQKPEELAPVPVSTIELDHWTKGYQGAKLINHILRGRVNGNSEESIPPIGVQRRASTGATAEKDPYVDRLLELIQQSAHTPVSVGDLVKRCGLSRRPLEQRFMKETGMSILEVLNDTRIKIAQKMLRETGSTLEEVAEASGFTSAPYFSRAFKRETGMTPGSYRSKHKVR
ncbi:xylose operon regulatory protein [Rubritalea halochordaticola]|uniref:Xylose operon regulatory protein n=1 Tax=Rubritalea halochordaticola TaxID=714537 RepID=A0ABP9UXE2_9BACT